MALVFMDGFDLKNGTGFRGWTFEAFEGTQSYVAGDIGGSAQLLSRFGGTFGAAHVDLYKILSSTYSELVWGFRFYVGATANPTQDFCRLLNSAVTVVIASIRFAAGGVARVVNGSGTTIGTGTRVVAGTGWHYLELRIKINGAAGECQLYVDGAEDIATTVGDFGSTNLGAIQYYGRWDDGVGNIYVDDVYVLDTTGGAPLNTFLGDSHIETLLPTSDGATLQWTPNTGVTGYTQVDDNPYDGDTTYVYSATPGDISTYGCADLSSVGPTVYAVQPNLMARKDDSGLRQIQPVIRQGGVNYSVGSISTLSTSYALSTSILPLDPLGAAWTSANVNADEFGVSLVT
jgi:hypothetical protein